MPAAASDPSTIANLINDYYAKKPDFTQYIGKEAEDSPADQVENLQLDEKHLRPYQRIALKQRKNMPVHPAEEHAGGNITDQVAKESSDSTASSHPHHQEDTKATSGGSIGAFAAHKANPGPVQAENIGQPASKEELKKRAEELNK